MGKKYTLSQQRYRAKQVIPFDWVALSVNNV